MAAKVPSERVQELHYTIPKELREIFMRDWRFIGPWPPAPGYWPIDIRILLEAGLLEKLAANPEFTKQYQIVIMPRTNVGV
jgi:hypothetical protein